MEVLYDLDTEATAKAVGPAGAPLSVGADPRPATCSWSAPPVERGQEVTPCASARSAEEPQPVPGQLCPARARRRGTDSPYT
ncbi:hypothetical protein SGLAM104S_06498 [Streptomyces glaucescens]